MKIRISEHLSLPLEAITNTFAIFGIRGSGKSNVAAVMAEGIIRAGQPVCVIDPTGSWYGLKTSADGKSPGLPVYVFGGEHADVPLEPTTGEVVANFVIENRVPAILDLKLMRKYQQLQFVTAFAETLFHRNREPLMVFVDEVARFAPQIIKDRGPDTARCLGALEDITGLGRTRGLGMTLIGQRPAPVSTTLRTQCETLVCLRTIGKHDRKAIDEWVEAKGTQEERNKMMADLAELPDGTGYFWSPAFLRIFEKLHFLRRSTLDSGATPKIGQKVIEPRAFAEVDKRKLSADIQATIEKAKAEDPKLLRQKIAELQKELSKKAVQPEPAKADPEARKKSVDAAFTRGFEAGKKAYRQEIAPKIKDFVNNATNDFGEALGVQINRLQKASAALKKELQDSAAKLEVVHPVAPVAPAASATVAKNQTLGYIQAIKSNGASSVGGMARKILTVLAQYPVGMNLDRLAILAGSTVNGHFNNTLGSLRTGGFVSPARVTPIQITQDGFNALGHYDPLPVGAELRKYWIRCLGNGMGSKILRALIAQYPETISLDELAAACESTVNGHFNNSIGSLRTMGLMTPARTPIKASDYLFEE